MQIQKHGGVIVAKDKMDFSNPQLSDPKKKTSLRAKVGYGLLIFFGIAFAMGQASPVPPTSLTHGNASSSKVAETDDACSPVKTSVTIIRTAFSEGTASPEEMSLLLDSAIGDWKFAAQVYTGSKSDWLNKMAEKGEEVKSYILTGSPSNGPQSFNQLTANMNLVDQFCG